MKVVIQPDNLQNLTTTQRQFELEIAQVLEYGDIQAISNISGIGYKYLDSQLSPNDERKSYLFGALQIICALDQVSPDRGEKVWQILAKIRELNKPAHKANLSVNDEIAKTNKEFSDIWQARLDGKSLYEQLGEIIEHEAQTAKLKMAVIDEINAEKDSFDKPQTRLKRVA